MNKRAFLIVAPILAFMLTGCNTEDDQVTNVPDNVPVEGTATNTQTNETTPNDGDATTLNTVTQTTTDTAFNFTSFDLDVEYGNNEEYDVDYENEANGMEAEISDDRAKTQIKGDEAFALLRPIFESFTFDQNTPNEEVISEVLKAFELDDNYQNFELEIQFTDGTKKEYNKRK